ncbi:MAG: D-serine ammonia-lyase [Candidatus Brocadiia bacterium]
MRTRAVAEADQLAEQRELKPQQIREAAAEIAGITGSVPVPDAEIGEPFQVWVHDWRSLMLRPEPDIELPATWLTGRGQQPATTLLHFDDNGRHRMLRRGGILTGAMRFIDRDRQPLNLLTVDLRGWGDTRPTMYPYEMAGWGSVDRYVAYATAALGDHIMAMRIRDALGTLAWLKEQPEVDPSRIILTGSGLGSMVALHAAAIDKNIGAVVTSEGLSSFRSLLEAANYPWPADTFMPNALNFYDLPELAAALTCPVRAHALRDGTGAAAGEKELTKWQEHDHIVAKTEGESGSLRKSIEELANRSEAIINLQERQPFLWVNPHWQPANQCLHSLPMAHNDIEEAEARWQRFAPLLEKLFPELRETNGIIESDLLPAPSLAKRILPPDSGKLMVKADHALPVAGSIKARGGIYAVLHFAESVALENGLLENKEDDYLTLSSDEAKQVFHTYELSVASTGNLGLSIGITGSALGFPVTVHMSHEAKEWKKERLRHRDVNVIEHQSDYTAACKVARQEAADNPRNHFIDDENSVELFLGYATALPRLKHQLTQAGITIDSEHPLFIYLPCGVGGAPGGITFAARHVFGDDAHCFFVEPVDAPCMTLGLLSERHFDTSIYALGLDLETDADGLAVSRPSRFVGKLMVPLLSGCCTMEDEAMYRHVLDLYETESIEVEPSAAAGCVVPWMLFETDAGRQYLEQHTLTPCLPNTTHLVWTTGGLFVPPKQHQHFRDIARKQKKR